MSKEDERRERLAQQRERWVQVAAERREARFDDFLFMIQNGTSAEVAAVRLGTNAVAMSRQAYRWHRVDIVRCLSSVNYRQRHGL